MTERHHEERRRTARGTLLHMGIAALAQAAVMTPAIVVAEYDDGAYNPFNPDSKVYLEIPWLE